MENEAKLYRRTTIQHEGLPVNRRSGFLPTNDRRGAVRKNQLKCKVEEMETPTLDEAIKKVSKSLAKK
jgi:hypothetical protein